MYRRIFLLLAALSFAAPASAQSWELVWQDEFSGSQLDMGKWEPQIGNGCPNLCGWGNNELQYYRAENATVSGGVLTITAREQSFGGADYTSARLRTKNLGDWTYGRLEMSAKMPIGQGIWPAFWMLPTDEAYGGWAASGEIDIVEYLGQDPDRVLGTIHYGGSYPLNASSGSSYTLTSGTFHDDFHLFALEWEPCELRWYVDDVLYWVQSDWYSDGGPYPAPFDQRFHLLLNLAVGGNLPGPPDGTTQFPQELVVDYVRVYQERPDVPACTLDFDGMDHADPFGNGWFAFGGSVGGGGIDANLSDLPPVDGCRASLQSGWGSGGTPGFFGGFGRNRPRDLSGITHFNLWIHPDAGQEYTLEINLQDDDDGDDTIPTNPNGADDEFQYELQVGPSGPGAISGGGWQYVSIPLSSFHDDNSYHYGGNGILDPVPVSEGGNGQLINVVIAVVSVSGADVTFRTDRWNFTRQTGAISGRVWEDTDGDGTDDGGEPGIEGLRLDLVDTASGSTLQTAVTSMSGEYGFGDLLAGIYEVRIDPTTLPPGLLPTFDPDGVESPGQFVLGLECDETASSQSFGFAPTPSSASDPTRANLPLGQNAPNPFHSLTTIRFDLTEDGPVVLAIYDVAGREVRTLVRGFLPAGSHVTDWDARDGEGRRVAGGVYYYRLRTREGEWIRQMTPLD